MYRFRWKNGFLVISLTLLAAGCSTAVDSNESSLVSQDAVVKNDFVGSSSCKECHARFYELWEPSHHGRAMQVFTPEFARTQLTPHEEFIQIGNYEYQARIGDEKSTVFERGPDGEKEYPIAHALGGKNLYYFLTPLEKGHLQVLPLAYDVRERTWYDSAGSMVRHFVEGSDEAIDWRERPLTFNTSCHGCHVSQMQTNYNLETDEYRTTWLEPGINCETCHGPAEEHVKAAREAGEKPLEDPKLIVTTKFTAEETNDMCAPCHAKMFPLSDSFIPGDRYFDHFGLHTLENADFYPDGRDLGENYTFTLWRMSPCNKSDEFDCLHCHTSSGRNRHTGDQADRACQPCHDDLVKNIEAHTFHKPESEGSRCVSCHMPKTEFARMERHDHSMLPPTPATTIEFQSPNACNICHTDKSAEWSNQWVTKWYGEEYQKPILERSRLLDQARKGNWQNLSEILQFISDPEEDEIYKASFIRLLEGCPDPSKMPAIMKAASDPSPLVRTAAVTGIGQNLTPDASKVLLKALSDDYRLVRVRAASSLAELPIEYLSVSDRSKLREGLKEYEETLKSRPDDWSFHYNLGNLYSRMNRLDEALEAFDISMRLSQDNIAARVNASMIHARLGNNSKAEKLLRDAVQTEPKNPEANFNLGLLLAEMGQLSDAEKHLKITLENAPEFAEAAFNLGILLSDQKPVEALQWSKKAAELRPEQPRYSYTYAFYLNRSGNLTEAADVLMELIHRFPEYSSAYALLGNIYESEGKVAEAREIYRKAVNTEAMSPADRMSFEAKLRY
jgi:tetratricopeptide (TPR) repeat protein